MRKPFTILAAMLAALVVMAAPASAAPPERTDEPFFSLFLDLNNGVVVFWNITRDDFCAWEAGGFVGDPPVQQLVPATSHPTGKGAIIGMFGAESTLELWALDADADLSGPCQDTDASTAPWASGSAHVRANDNDIFVSLTRTNTFGERGQGTVVDGDGQTWHYSWVFRAHVTRDDEFIPIVVDRTNLTPR